MYAYWYEEGQLMAYEGTKADFKMSKDSNNYYMYGDFQSMHNEWFKAYLFNGNNSICNIFADDVPSEIRALHLLLVKE